MSRTASDLVPFKYPEADGALNHSMMLLACGHDSCGGRYVLDSHGSIYTVWPKMQEEESFTYINQQMEQYAKRMGGMFIPNPRSSALGGGKMQATHPLGGAPMGQTAAQGAVNHLGQLFDGKGGLHEGFYVVDAATLPTSLAAPPLITITALAERSLKHFVKEKISCPVALEAKKADEPPKKEAQHFRFVVVASHFIGSNWRALRC